jgi:hypothetical protein
VREDAIVDQSRLHSNGDKRSGRRDEAVDDDRPLTRGRPRHRARHHRDFATAKFTEYVKRNGRRAARGRSPKDGSLAIEAGLIVSRAVSNAPLKRGGGQAVHKQGGRRGVAYAHLAERNGVRALVDRFPGYFPPPRQSLFGLLRRQGGLFRSVPRSFSHFGVDQARMGRKVGSYAGVDDLDVDVDRASKRVHTSLPCEKGHHHCRRDFCGVAGHSIFRQSVIAGKDKQNDALDARVGSALDESKLNGKLLEAT